ncbi:unnamed protein product [Aureobasidium vineae]|uniref:Uncharacterized protein n=1 Tax=Aureobasidium vineae TaxID=2773715 RepID=A0A9N8JVR8_9PEZI|nr:unnamed protein product [Aureobasidium vineae]
MAHADKQAGFEKLWDQMEMLAKSRDKTDKKRSRGIAEDLVDDYSELPRSYHIRAYMALASLLCARDSLREVAEYHAEIQTEARAELRAKILAELQAELRTIREAYKNKAMQDCIVVEGDEAVENTQVSSLTATTQLGPGSQEELIDLTLDDGSIFSNNNNTSYSELIDLTLDDDCVPSNNSGDESSVNFDSGVEEGTDILSTQFSSPPRSNVSLSMHPRTRVELIVFSVPLFVHPPIVLLIPTPTAIS